MLLGEFRHSLDSKGRVFLPARWRETLGSDVVITKGLDGCLYLMAHAEFDTLAARLGEMQLENPNARAYSRVFFAKASEETVDAQGRITIPGHLRETAGLTKDVVLTGASGRAEIWDRSAYDNYIGDVEGQYEEIARQLL